MHVKIAAQVWQPDQPRQPPRFGGLDLAAIFAQLGRNVCEPERLVNSFLRLTRDERAVVHAVQAVLVQLEAALNRAIAEDDVVGPGAGEVLERRTGADGWDQAQVGLKAAPQPDAGLGFAV